MGDSPAAILFDSEGNELAREDGSSIDSTTSALLIAGKDGSTMRFIRVDDNGRPIFVGAGTAGTPTGGVVSVQGVSGGEAIPVTLDGESITVNSNQLSIQTIISDVNQNIASAPYSNTVVISQDTLLKSLSLIFTTTQSRDVEVSLSNGTILVTLTGDTSLTLDIDFEEYAIDSGTSLTVDISQTGGACLVDVILTTIIGTSNLGGNPVLGEGNSYIGQVGIERNEFGSLIKFEANTNEELRSDDISLGDLYHGRAVDGTATSVASWEVIRFYRTTSGLITRVRYKSGISWDNRASAGNWL